MSQRQNPFSKVQHFVGGPEQVLIGAGSQTDLKVEFVCNEGALIQSVVHGYFFIRVTWGLYTHNIVSELGDQRPPTDKDHPMIAELP